MGNLPNFVDNPYILRITAKVISQVFGKGICSIDYNMHIYTHNNANILCRFARLQTSIVPWSFSGYLALEQINCKNWIVVKPNDQIVGPSFFYIKAQVIFYFLDFSCGFPIQMFSFPTRYYPFQSDQ